jgi:hypothetical protein
VAERALSVAWEAPRSMGRFAGAATFALLLAEAAVGQESLVPEQVEFSPIDGLIYNKDQVGHRIFVDYLVGSKYGLPEIAERHLVTSAGDEIVVYYDPSDEKITYRDLQNVTHPSFDDANPNRLAVVVYRSGDFGLVLGVGGLRPEVAASGGPDREGIARYDFYLNHFVRNHEDGPSWVAAAHNIDLEALRQRGFEHTELLEFGEAVTLRISLLSGPPGDFIRAEGFMLTGPLAESSVSAIFGRLEPVR